MLKLTQLLSHFIYGFMAIIQALVLKQIFNSRYGVLKEQAAAEGRGELHSFFKIFLPKV
jgi:putative aldouronate transport system permease protein